VVRQAHLIAVVLAFVIGCAVLLLAVGCAGTRSEAPKEQQQRQAEATGAEGRSPEATAPEEAQCDGVRTIKQKDGPSVVTNDVPGCPKGGLLSGTDGPDFLDGRDGEDEIRGLGAKDYLLGESGSDVLYGGPGDDFLKGNPDTDNVPIKDVLYGGPGRDQLSDWDGGDDVLYGGDGDDGVLVGGAGDDVIYGGDGNDSIDASGVGQHDKLYCGAGRDHYAADKLDYVSSSCEVKFTPVGSA
jgi:hypothetical protein